MFTLEFAYMRLHFKARGHLRLPPYKGSTFRGAFGVAFKRAVCIVQHGLNASGVWFGHNACIHTYLTHQWIMHRAYSAGIVRHLIPI